MTALVDSFPEIAAQWHPTKNEKLKIENISSYSNRRAWFKCEKGHEWESIIGNRTRHKRGCPYCSHQKVLPETSLAMRYPDIASEWHPDNILKPNEVFPGTTKHVLWKCKKGHVWKARVDHRVCCGSGCIHCKSSKSEEEIDKILSDKKVSFRREWWHSDCRGERRPLPFDFAIFKEDSLIGLIEYQGVQHFKPIKFGSGNPIEALLRLRKRDEAKKAFCQKCNIPLLTILNTQEILPSVECFLGYLGLE